MPRTRQRPTMPEQDDNDAPSFLAVARSERIRFLSEVEHRTADVRTCLSQLGTQCRQAADAMVESAPHFDNPDGDGASEAVEAWPYEMEAHDAAVGERINDLTLAFCSLRALVMRQFDIEFDDDETDDESAEIPDDAS